MKSMKERLLDFKAAQEAGTYTKCPRCGCNTMKPALYTNALSRLADIMVCDGCGIDEAKHAYMGVRETLSSWACMQPIRPATDFKAIRPNEAQVIILREQLPQLIDAYKEAQKPDADWDALRLNTYETCAGLTALWIKPFQASYDVLGGKVRVCLLERDGGIAVAVCIIPHV